MFIVRKYLLECAAGVVDVDEHGATAHGGARERVSRRMPSTSPRAAADVQLAHGGFHRPDVPQPHVIVVRSRDDGIFISRRRHDARHAGAVRLTIDHLRPRRVAQIPSLESAIIRARVQHVRASRVERDRPHL